jgi:hypothetical protein
LVLAVCRLLPFNRTSVEIKQARTSPEMLVHARAGNGGSAAGGRGRGETTSSGGGGGRGGGGKKAPQQSAIEQHYLAELRKFIEEKGAPPGFASASGSRSGQDAAPALLWQLQQGGLLHVSATASSRRSGRRPNAFPESVKCRKCEVPMSVC